MRPATTPSLLIPVPAPVQVPGRVPSRRRDGRRRHGLACAVVGAALLLAACGPSTPSAAGAGSGDWPETVQVGAAKFVPVIISSELVAGQPNRFSFSVLDAKGKPIAGPGLKTKVAFYDLAASKTKPVSTTAPTFEWAIPNERGIYNTPADFSRPGTWGAAVTIDGTALDGAKVPSQTERVRFDVRSESTTPAVGSPAPNAPTKTAADAGGDLSNITTDPNPDPSLYAMSVPQALAAKQPFVVTFATPKFCQSQVCGPTLDVVKAVKAQHPNVNFLHVEVYDNLKSDNLVPVPAMDAWKLRSEPWVFVVGADGNVAAKFEGGVSADELNSAIAKVAPATS